MTRDEGPSGAPPDGAALVTAHEFTAHILLIDDDPKSLLAMESLLTGRGRKIHRAESGQAALRLLLRQDFALILLDVRMPVMDGFETAALIRQRERSRYTPIIFLSAVDTLGSDVMKGVSSGAVDYLFKPVVPQVLQSKVAVFVDLFHLNERLKRQAIRQSEERFRLLVESMQDYAISMLDSDGRVTSWNAGAERTTGFTHEEIVGKSVTCFYTPDDQAAGHPTEVLEQAARESRHEEETWLVRKDGSKFWANVIVTALRDESGRLLGFSRVTRDLTERKRAEEALRLAEKHLRAVLTNAPIALFAVDREGVFTLVEGKGLQGFSPESVQWVGRSVFDLFRDFPHILSGIERALQGEISTNSEAIGERWYETNYTPLLNEDGGRVVGVIGVALDVTEQKRAEEEMFRANKMESIGVLAGGIAHDFNNILTAVVGNLALAKMQVTPGDLVMQRLMDSEKAVLRAQSLTRQLLTFSRGGEPIRESIVLTKLLRESAEFALQGSNVECEFSIPPDIWPVEADSGQINQVISNLVLNAQQGMPQGGAVVIRAVNMVVNIKDGLPLSPGKYVGIQIQDSGEGIAEGHLAKIFDPFFTTKSQGTGLGLTTVYWILKRHGGHIAIESKRGEGTTAWIYLPKAEREATKEPVQKRLIRGRGRILFMDDEAPIREFATGVLNQLGYETQCAQDGEEAVELFRKAHDAGHPFRAVILDLTIRAGMGGKDAVKRLIEIDPAVKAIVSSGYSNDPVMADVKRYGFSERIIKPYRVEDLSQILAEVLGTQGMRAE